MVGLALSCSLLTSGSGQTGAQNCGQQVTAAGEVRGHSSGVVTREEIALHAGIVVLPFLVLAAMLALAP